jgi:glycosyltransferase involved in cell wall biosynthesis
VHKGLDLLIEGFALYRRRGGTGRLEMAGTGPERETLERMVAAHGIADATRVGGPLFGEAKAQALATWDYFVAPSRFDGFPLGPTQAALSGLPLVLSAATGLKRHVEESGAGLIIDTLTPEAVADALARAGSADASAWVAMSAAAYRMALAFGDWSAVSDRLLALYRGG